MSLETLRNCQKGTGTLKAILWTGILIGGIYVGFQVLPAYVNDYEFRDTMATAARFASVRHDSLEDVRANLFKEAQKADMPLSLQDIKVSDHNGRIDINADYSVTVDLHVYQWKLNFHPSASSDRL
jgi:Domain of unknown function (DUF4845)